jgi:predicted DNA-binding transcriptional regulator AlpA
MAHAVPTRTVGSSALRAPTPLHESTLMDDEYWSTFSDPLPLAELALILRLSETTVLRRLQDATIPGHFVGGSWIVFQSEFRAWLASRRNLPTGELPNPDPLLGRADQLGMAELMEIFGKTKQTIRRWLNEQQIPGYVINGRWVVHTHELRQALNNNANKPTIS